MKKQRKYSENLAGHAGATTSEIGISQACNRKSYHASVSVMLEKSGGCCRTGPRRVRSCQMLHTIAAINAAWCRSMR